MPAAPTDYQLEMLVKIPLRDGVKLNATLYKPVGVPAMLHPPHLTNIVPVALKTHELEKNWNSMNPVAEQSGADARVAHIKLLQTAAHPCPLTLPLGDPTAARKASADW